MCDICFNARLFQREIAIAFVGVVDPGVGIVSAEAADETTITYDLAFNGFDASVVVAADIERGQGVAAGASAGVAIAEAIKDAVEIIDSVTDIVDEVNVQVTERLAEEEARLAEEEALRLAGGDAAVTAQSQAPSPALTPAARPNIVAARNGAESFSRMSTAKQRTGMGKIPTRGEASTVKVRAQASGKGEDIEPKMAPEGEYGEALGDEYGEELEEFGGTDYDYEAFGSVSGTYAVAVSLIFLEQISLNGGSITII